MRKKTNQSIFTGNTRNGAKSTMKRSLSAALIASTIMAGGAFADIDTIGGSVTISGTVEHDNVTLRGPGTTITADPIAPNTPTINVNDSIVLEVNYIADVDLTGTASFRKTTGGIAGISAGVNGNSWTGPTSIEAGTLQVYGAKALSSVSDVTISSGATLLLTAGSSNSLTSLAGAGALTFGILPTDAATLTVGLDNSTTTFSGTITGGEDNEITKVGTGTWILTGNSNDFDGNLAVEAGTVQLGDGTTSGYLNDATISIAAPGKFEINLANGNAFAGTAVNDGMIVVTGSGDTLIDADISGTGSFTVDANPTAKVTLFGGRDQYTYTGATIIKSGTLATADDFAIPELSAVTVEADAVLDIEDSWQSFGSLSGAGTVNIQGDDFHWDLDDNLIYDLTVGNDNTDAIFTGELINDDSPAAIAKVGTGAWVLEGQSSFTGYLDVLNGALIIGNTAGSLASFDGEIGVLEDGFLAGHGTIGYIYNDGVVLPGAQSVGTLTVGEYWQTEDGTLITRVNSTKSHDHLLVTGDPGMGYAAELDGTLLVHRGSKKVRAGDRVNIIYAPADYIDGTFSKVRLTEETMIGVDVIYGDDYVDLEFYQKDFAGLNGLTHNQKQVAKALDKITGKKGTRDLFDRLNNESISNVKNDIAALSPEAYASIFNIGFATAQIQNVNIERRLSDVREGARGFSANGLALSNARGTLNYDGMPIVNERDGLSLAGFDGKSIVTKQTVAPIVDVESRWGFFATGTGEWADIESTSQVHGGNFTTGGVTIGADYRVSENLVLGISGSYANTSSELWNNGDLDVNSGRGAVYATAFAGGAYLNALVGGGYNSYETDYEKLGGRAKGDTNSGEFDALLGGGYDFQVGGFTVGPVASVQYTYIGLSSFQEDGSIAPMAFPSQSQNSLRSTVGAKASYAFVMGETIIRPEVRAQWAHEFLDSNTAIEAGFAAGGGAFSVNGQNVGRDSLLLDAGVSVEFSPSCSVFAYYTGEIGRSNYSSNAVNGGFRINF